MKYFDPIKPIAELNLSRCTIGIDNYIPSQIIDEEIANMDKEIEPLFGVVFLTGNNVYKSLGSILEANLSRGRSKDCWGKNPASVIAKLQYGTGRLIFDGTSPYFCSFIGGSYPLSW